jgi:hypothetical protein
MEFIRHVGELGMPVSLILSSALERSLVAAVESMARAYNVRLLGAIEKPATAKTLAAVIGRYGATASRSAHPAPPAFALAEIEQALARGEFVPFFQPKMDLVTGEVKGAAAVARWLHPQKGTLPPDCFVPVLEEADRLRPLTDMMLRKGAACCAQWLAAKSKGTLSINVSLSTLYDMSVADALAEIVSQEGITPRDGLLHRVADGRRGIPALVAQAPLSHAYMCKPPFTDRFVPVM